ncbi:hypothetical protein DV736_g1394, partial [Chaetothyriales sp. CBS 134916]
MDGGDIPNLSAWLGNPVKGPAQSLSRHVYVNEDDSDTFAPDQKQAATNSEREAEGVSPDGPSSVESDRFLKGRPGGQPHKESGITTMPQFKQTFYFDLPTMDKKEKAKFGYMRGHFTVRKILGEYRGDRFLVKLASGEKQLVTSRELQQLSNGSKVLKDYQYKMARSRRSVRRLPGMVNWASMPPSDSDVSEPPQDANRSEDPPLYVDGGDSESDRDQSASDEDDFLTEESQPKRRRSSRKVIQRPNYSPQDLNVLEDEPERPQRTRGRAIVHRGPRRPRRSHTQDSYSSPERVALTRRSERNREKQKKDMREKQEDEIHSHSEDEVVAKVEQQQREENGGRDPITIVDKGLLNNIDNVLFRCCLCQRAWHMHHLPPRNVTSSQPDEDEDDETLDDGLIAQKRFELYHRSWLCKDCIENQSQIDVIVAWRPVDLDSYITGFTSEVLQESQKEYLIKWKNHSYLRVTWMPGTWVWSVAAGAMRTAFNKKLENKLPRMTTKDAIPEDFFRTDIVFDVKYSSVVRNSTQEIDMARAKEVDTAYMKYKGLGYEDTIWEKPPNYQDSERWEDYRVAYEEYVLKLYTHIPRQSTLRRHLATIRTYDFESQLLRKEQPTLLTGGKLMEYQMEGLNWLYYQWYSNQNAILADEMGLGKTIQLISFFALLVEEHKCWPFLVVVPNSTCPNWRREIQKWAPSLRAVCYYGSSVARKLTHDYELFPKDDRDEHENKGWKKSECKDIRAHVVITSYESIVEDKTRQSLMRVPWQGLIVDEGQRLKNDKNLLYDCLGRFRFPFKVLLTGTPLQNNIRELFNIIQFLDKTVNAAEMEARYATLTKENIPELHAQLQKFFLRRTKAKVLSFLPPMAQIIVPVTMTPLQKKLYRSILAKNPALMKSVFSRDSVVSSKERVNLNGILVQLRKTLCHPFVYSKQIEERGYDSSIAHRGLVEASSKLQLLSIMLPKLQERGHRVLMFSQFIDNLDIMEDFLDGLGLQHRRLDGNTSSLDKQKKIDEFNAPDSPYFAFLLSTRAGGVGINLATADTVIILDPDFNPHQDIQALSRAHRIGQKQKVLVFQLVTKSSAEEKIFQIGKKKMAIDHVLIDSMERNSEEAVDLESILRHGAEALFQDEGQEDIVYDSVSVDRLLDRSQVEDTKASEDKSAESQFSFARVWAYKTSTLEDVLDEDSHNGADTSNSGIWDKILQERERAFAEEAARNVETLGRGKRKRQNIDYGDDGLGELQLVKTKMKTKEGSNEDGSDTDFQADEQEDELAEEYESADEDDSEEKHATIKVQPFERAIVPTGRAPYINMDGAAAYNIGSTVPPVHQCSVCEEVHPIGWCRLKLAGVEYCGLCGIAHLGHSRTCPNLNNEDQVFALLQSLKESTEPRELVEAATKYLRTIRGDLAQRKRLKEKGQEALAKPRAETNGVQGQMG